MRRSKQWWSQFTDDQRQRLVRIERWRGAVWYAPATRELLLSNQCPGCLREMPATIVCRDCDAWYQEVAVARDGMGRMPKSAPGTSVREGIPREG